MNANTERRLARLEAATKGGFDLAAMIEVGRRRARELPPMALPEERRARLVVMLEQHAARALRGLPLRLLIGLERVHAVSGAAGAPA